MYFFVKYKGHDNNIVAFILELTNGCGVTSYSD